MHYLIYKITNRLDNKFYIGKHKTTNRDDDYFGSGLLLERAVAKHGKENFVKEILFELPTEEEMNQKEADIVDEDFVMRDDTYNIMLGGQGGWDYVLKNRLNQTDSLFESCRQTSHLGVEKLRELWKDPTWRELQIEKRREARLEFLKAGGVHPFKGKHHTEETKKAISEKLKVLHSSEKNPTKGRIWITNEIESKMIYPTDPIPAGFRRGISTEQRMMLKKHQNKTMSPDSRKKIGDAVRERHRRLKMDGSTK